MDLELIFSPTQAWKQVCNAAGSISRKTFFNWRDYCNWVYDEYPQQLVEALTVFANYRNMGRSYPRCKQSAINYLKENYPDA